MKTSLAVAVAGLSAFFSAPTSAQTTWYVDVAATAPGLGTQTAPYASIQYAIDQAATVAGDTLSIAAGTYNESIDLRGKSLVLDGSNAATKPVLDGAGASRIVRLATGEGPATLLRDLVLLRGSAGQDTGGCILLDGASATFQRVEVRLGVARLGGGAAVRNGIGRFVDCTFEGCRAELGGALAVEQGAVALVDGELRANRATGGSGASAEGGAVYVDTSGALVVDRSRFIDNRSIGGFGGGGGAVRVTLAALPSVVRDAWFEGNAPGDGLLVGFGGAVWASGPFQAERTTFIRNGTPAELDSTLRGGAGRGGTYRDCTFLRNGAQLGGGLADAIAFTSTFQSNTACADGSGNGGGVFAASLTDCVLVDNWTCGDGGGAHTASVVGGRIELNRALATLPGVGGLGGGVFRGDVTGTLLRGNEAIGSGGWPSEGGGAHTATLNACVLVSNRADRGAAYAGSAFGPPGVHSRLSIVGNIAPVTGDIITRAALRNALVWHNFGPVVGSLATFDYCNVQVPVAGIGNLSTDPLIFARSGADVRLRAGSPCIDAGDPAAPFDPDGSRADIGALPFDPSWSSGNGNYCLPSRAAGCLAQISAVGAASLSSPVPIEIRGTGMEPGQPTILLIGLTPNAARLSAPGFDPVTICVGAPFVRGPVQSISAGPPCGGTAVQPLSGAFLGSLGATPGSRVHAQFWFRALFATALTDAIDILVVP